MVLKDIVAFLLCTLAVLCDSILVNKLGRCSIHDRQCHKEIFQDVLKNTAEVGIPILDLPPTDPYYVKNATVSIYGILDISLIDGTVRGIKDCSIDNFDTQIKDGRATMEITCDLTVKGLYKISPAYAIVKSSSRDAIIHGQGYGRIKLEKLHLRLELDFFVEENKNGEIYIKCKNDKLNHEYKTEKVTFGADKLYFGNEDVSKTTINMLNEHSSFAMSTFGKPVMEEVVANIYSYLRKFFDSVPAKYFIEDDLSPYIKY